jgi:ribosomal protein S18 acetylase RimI-like enzyme
MNLKIRKLEKADIPDVLAMIREFAEQINLIEYCKITAENFDEVLFGENSFVQGLVALVDEKIVAYTIFFPYFSSFKGQKSLYLEDIYIKPDFRRFGLGEKMIREIAKIAKTQNATRIDFQVLKSNEKAIKFYKKLGAVSNDDEVHFKFDDEAFQNLAN